MSFKMTSVSGNLLEALTVEANALTEFYPASMDILNSSQETQLR
jgi:hypothetical protein